MRDVAERAFEKGDEEATGVFHAFTYQGCQRSRRHGDRT